ncbi:MAG: hypothetical protein ABEJ65_10015, partial [bacterium]
GKQNEESNNKNGELKSTYITTTTTETTRKEIPITRGNLRVVLTMSAVIYDLRKDRVVWQGRRIERAQDELADLSSIELKDIVVERIMYRINNRITK